MHDTRGTRLVLGLLLVAALALITVDYRDGSSSVLSGIRQVGGSVLGGIERAASAATAPVARFVTGGTGSGSSAARVSTLERQLVSLRAELSRAQLSRADYAQLSALLQLSGRGGYRVVAASVIAYGQGYQRTVTLDAGSRDGVQPRETVLNGQGLVGEVTSVSAQTCTVLLASDPSSVVGVRLAPAGQIGWVTGPGTSGTRSGLLKLQVLNASAVLRPGEQLVTAASVQDRPYVPGVPVGVIAVVENSPGALTGVALARPYADLTALGVVGIVIERPRRDPRFSVLPRRPSVRPAPAVTVTVNGATSAAPAASPGSGG